MAHTKKTLPASRPRNVVVRALIARFGFAGTKRHESHPRQRAVQRQDLDDRIREVGEW